MISHRPIRVKLLLGFVLLLLVVGILAASSFYGLYAYRSLVRSLSARSSELPLAGDLSDQVTKLRVTLESVRTSQSLGMDLLLDEAAPIVSGDFPGTLLDIKNTLTLYRGRLDINAREGTTQIDNDQQERETLSQFEGVLKEVAEIHHQHKWVLDGGGMEALDAKVNELHELSRLLPSHLHQRMQALAKDVRVNYRSAILLTWFSSLSAVALFLMFLRLFYGWVLLPLRVLIAGSRRVASGAFHHRIELATHDEMSELADAMNGMTKRFRAIRDDLDQQVRERTKQVVQSEKLASVGFLAAGVAHEINNPLASIALCSESLERRIHDVPCADEQNRSEVAKYLRMIQEEAFRCKEITEKLLDFSRIGEVMHQRTELGQLVQGVIDMIKHLGRYHEKQVRLKADVPVFAQVNPQEMKQVVLNLLTNGLDSLDHGGEVVVEIHQVQAEARLVFTDNGCGMTSEVLKHIFEPFFTRRRGGDGTGLGLSITYRIVADHNGHIDASSEGPGKGSRFVVRLPACATGQHEEMRHQYQAA